MIPNWDLVVCSRKTFLVETLTFFREICAVFTRKNHLPSTKKHFESIPGGKQSRAQVQVVVPLGNAWNILKSLWVDIRWWGIHNFLRIIPNVWFIVVYYWAQPYWHEMKWFTIGPKCFIAHQPQILRWFIEPADPWNKHICSHLEARRKRLGPAHVQCEAPKIAKLVNITPITMVYGIYNYSYWGL